MKLANRMDNKKILLLIVLLSLITRFFILDARPMDHDESIHAYLSYILMKNNYYRYDPAFHGPFLYYTTAAVFYLLGDSEFTSRLIPAVFSFLCIFTAYYFKKWIDSGAYLLVFFILFSTSILYYSRYMRNDIIICGAFLAIILFYLKYLESKKPIYIALISFLFGIILTAKENGYIYLFTFISYLGLRQIALKTGKIKFTKLLPHSKLKIVYVILASTLPFLLIFSALYTNLFTYPNGLNKATVGAISHWLEMHERKDHWKPIYYYSKLLIQYEFFPLGLFFISIPFFVKRLKNKQNNELEFLSLYWVVLSFLAYHYISHKVPWLVLHLVLPLSLFSSLYANELNKKLGNYFKLIICVGVILTLFVSLNINYINYNDVSEDLIYVQIQPPTIELSKKIIELESSGETVVIYEPTNDYWPLPWYLRHEKRVFFSSQIISNYKYIVTSEKFINEVEKKGYRTLQVFLIRPGHYLILTKRC